MNGIAANMLLHLTSSVRFEGALNVDLNEITTNLVPFPRLHFLLASLSPLAAPRDIGKMTGAPRAIDQVHTSPGVYCRGLARLDKIVLPRTDSAGLHMMQQQTCCMLLQTAVMLSQRPSIDIAPDCLQSESPSLFLSCNNSLFATPGRLASHPAGSPVCYLCC